VTGRWRESKDLPLVIGHRGARREAPENTLIAFERAIELGAAGVELDVRLDGAGQVVVLHDRTLSRVTERRDERDIELVRDVGDVDLGRGARVPTLAETVDWARAGGHLLNVELKHDCSSRLELVRRVVRVTRPARELVLFSSFDPLIVRLLAWLLPDSPVAWLVHQKQRLFKYAPGYRMLGAIGVNPELALATDARIRRLKRRDAFVAVWTVNDTSAARRLASAGVDAIISDVPGEIVAALA